VNRDSYLEITNSELKENYLRKGINAIYTIKTLEKI
jgi:hypothetical protein